MDSLLVEYYNKFNENKRLKSRHGQVEFNTTMHFLHEAIAECISRKYGCADSDIESERYADARCASEKDAIERCADARCASEKDAAERYADARCAKLEIADIGAGTGGYTIPLLLEGHNVTAVELVKYNLGILKKNAACAVENAGRYATGELTAYCENSDRNEAGELTAYCGNAKKLKKLADNSFDITLLLGPMYHLHSFEEKMKALNEAKRITKVGGYILVAYVMADYAVVKYGFMENNIKDSLQKGDLNEDYSIKSKDSELYDYVRLDDINQYNESAGLKRVKIVAPDGPADYIRNILNEMDEETFKVFLDYQIKNAERQELLGASSHTLDILQKVEG